MTTWTLLNPVGLLALVSLAGVLVIYLFVERHRPRPISGMFLWEAPPSRQLGGRQRDRLEISRSLLLDLLACALLALAVSRPGCTTRQGSARVIILDGSLSMRADRNHLEARRQAQGLLKKWTGTPSVVVLQAGETLLVLAKHGTAEARTALDAYDPYERGDSLQRAVRRARDLVSGNIQVHVFTDHHVEIPVPDNAELVTHVLAGRHPNLALFDATRYRNGFGTGERLNVVFKNISSEEKTVRVRLEHPGGALHEAEVVLAGQGTDRLNVELPPGIGPIEVRLEGPADAIAEDSRALLLETPDRTPTTAVELGDPDTGRFVRRALAAAGSRLVETSSNILVTD